MERIIDKAMEGSRRKIYNIIISLIYFFRQSIYYLNPSNGYFLVGNLDIFYLLAPMYAIQRLKKIKTMKKTTIIFFISCILYLAIQILFLSNLNIEKSIINVAKIIVCYFVMMYVKENYNKIDLKKICKIYSILCIIFLVLSIFFQNSILWRHNDYVNKYNLNRLQFLFAEPSELGFHSILIVLIYVFMIMQSKQVKDIFKYIGLTLPIIIILFLAKPLGSIGVGGIAIITLIIADLVVNYSKKKIRFYLLVQAILVIIMAYMVYSQNSIYLRIVDTINGKDTSSNYRIFVPFKVCEQILYDTHGLGIGFGNVKLEENVAIYSNLGLAEQGIINSYINLISESGIFGISLIGVIIYKLLKKSLKDKSPIKIALFVFIITYQFMGTYFTNPLCWIVYGIIFSDINFNKKIKDEDNKVISENYQVSN